LYAEDDGVSAVKITTTPLRQAWAYKLDKGTNLTSKGKIQKDSWVNLRRREIIPMRDVKKTVAALKPEFFEEICVQLTKILNS
jgi:hypothetical protein